MIKITKKKCEKCNRKTPPHVHYEGRVFFLGFEEEEKEFTDYFQTEELSDNNHE